MKYGWHKDEMATQINKFCPKSSSETVTLLLDANFSRTTIDHSSSPFHFPSSIMTSLIKSPWLSSIHCKNSLPVFCHEARPPRGVEGALDVHEDHHILLYCDDIESGDSVHRWYSLPQFTLCPRSSRTQCWGNNSHSWTPSNFFAYYRKKANRPIWSWSIVLLSPGLTWPLFHIHGSKTGVRQVEYWHNSYNSLEMLLITNSYYLRKYKWSRCLPQPKIRGFKPGRCW